MKNPYYFIKRYVFSWCLFLSFVLFLSCSDDDPDTAIEPEPAEPSQFAMVTSTLNSDGQTRAFFLQRVSVDSTGTIDNSGATELSPATSAMIHAFNGSIFFSD